METNTEAPSTNQQKLISIIRTLDSPVATIWQALTDPEMFKQWWGPNNYTCPECHLDVKPGGKYLAAMKAPDGKVNWSAGFYKEIVPLKRLVMTDSFSDEKGTPINAKDLGFPGDWPDELTINISLEDVDGKTRFSLVHEGIPEEGQDDCIQGWQECIDKMEKIK